MQEICKKYKVLLIIDEVVTGLGRTGSWFAYQVAAKRGGARAWGGLKRKRENRCQLLMAGFGVL